MTTTDYAEFQMPLADAMTTQRAIRKISSDPVDDELILKLISLALKGPTAQNQQQFQEIPVYIVACFRGSRFPFPPVVAASTYGSIFPAVQNLLLAARAAGLGANINTMPLWSNFIARRILGLPFSITPCVMIPIGWPIGRYGPTTRKPVGDVVSLDQYDNRVWKNDA